MLSDYEKIGGGVCEQQALLAGYFVEKTRRDGLCFGHTSIDRNESAPSLGAEEGGHAWLRYSEPDLWAFALDPAQDYVGRVEDARNWLYARAEDILACQRLPI